MTPHNQPDDDAPNACFSCDDKPDPADFTGTPPLCDACSPDDEQDDTPRSIEVWDGNDFGATESDVFPTSHTNADRWMGHSEKMPFAPWGERDHPEAGADEDARWKWGIEANYRPFKKAKMGVADPKVDGLAFIQQKEDPFVYVDGDDVRDPETGAVHPAFLAILNHLGETYADVSQSDSGVHAIYEGELPGDEVQMKIPLDADPWGENDEVPELEIYSTKRVLVMTGNHIAGTPTTAKEWDDDVVEAMCEAAGLLDSSVEGERPDPGRAREDYDFADYEPDAVTADETTGDARDVIAAVDRLHPQDVAERTIVHQWNDGATTSSNARAFVPTWGKDANGTANIVTDRVWQDTGGGGYGGPAVMAAIDAGIMDHQTANPKRLTGSDWWEAVDHLRELGFHIPKYDTELDDRDGYQERSFTDHVYLPGREETGRHIGWNIHDDAGGELTQQDVYDRTTATIQGAMQEGGASLIDGIMASGKTYSSFKAAAERDEPILYCSAREELYQQGREYAIENGYDASDVYVLPSIFRDCPSAAGEHGEAVRDRIRNLHSLGVTPKVMHSLLDLPCDDDGSCEYHAKMQFEPDDYEVLIGNYAHAHLPQVASGRHVIVDENPSDAYFETIEGNDLIRSINRFLSFAESPPFDDFHDLIEHRDDPERRQEALAWFDAWAAQEDWDPDEQNAVRYETDGYHALTPHAVYGIVDGEPVEEGSPFFRTVVNGRNPIVFRDADEDEGYRVTVNTPPSNALYYARSIIGLDGTPALLPHEADDAGPLGRAPEWNLALNQRFTIKRVLTDEERHTFIHDTQNINIIQTTDAIKPYSSGKYHNLERDFSIIEAAAQEYRHDPTVFTTKTVREEYQQRENDLPCDVRDWDHYGNLRGSDKYGSHRLGILFGSTHYGDEYLRERAALLGRSVAPEGKGDERKYGTAIGDALFEAMRESTIAQAALRFGRDGDGARVLIHTGAVPDWLPVEHEGEVVTTWTEAQRNALDLLSDGFEGTAQQMADHLSVGIRQTRNILNGLADRGAAHRQQDPDDGRRHEWTADDVGDVPVYGETRLPAQQDTTTETQKNHVQGSIREIAVTSPLAEADAVYHRRRGDDPDDVADDAAGAGGGDTALGD